VSLIEEAGFEAVERDTLYHPIKRNVGVRVTIENLLAAV